MSKAEEIPSGNVGWMAGKVEPGDERLHDEHEMLVAMERPAYCNGFSGCFGPHRPLLANLPYPHDGISSTAVGFPRKDKL